MIFQVLQNYLKNNNIKNYSLVQEIIPFTEFNKTLEFENAIIFLQEIYLFGAVNYANLKKNFITVNSFENFIDYKNSYKLISFDANYCSVTSNLVSIHKAKLNIAYDFSNFVLSDIRTGFAKILILRLNN